MDKAIGLIEVKGYATAIVVADTVLKVADINVIGIQRAKGSGWMTVEITGVVGAVRAAVEAGGAKANATGDLISVLIIPRPAVGLDAAVINAVDYPAKSIGDIAFENVDEQMSLNADELNVNLSTDALNNQIEATEDKADIEEQDLENSNSDISETPETPETPEIPEIPEILEEPEEPEKPEKPEKPESVNEDNDKSETSEAASKNVTKYRRKTKK